MMLGDYLEKALGRAGINPERIQAWLGKDCSGCKERRDKLNALHAWSRQFLAGSIQDSNQYLERLLQ